MNANTNTTAVPPTGTRRVAVRRRAFVAVAALLATLTAMIGGASAASAVTVSGSGYPGATTLPSAYASWTGFATGSMTVPWRSVTESARNATSAQYVCVRASLVEASGAQWIASNTSISCGWIQAAATSANVNGVVFNNLNGLNSAIYSVNVVVT